ncbi:MAG: hypothetical protein KTR30_14445 [Saprospiraceae bacterium]|nr:hypothetical protein [Saprospiraceae bacterium]
MRLFIALLFCMLASIPSFGQYTQLQVLDPQRNWDRRSGTIEEAAIVMKPQGIYTLVDLYLTFSARDQGFDAGRNLEVVLDFHLPIEAHMVDSWLWFNGQIIKAEMMDRWTATLVYEEIVGRNQDPSILYKEGNGQYQLRIFPMEAEASRKVKISYLMPAQWSAQQVSTALPLDILASSWHPLQTVNLRVWQEQEWGTPELESGASLALDRITDPDQGSFWEKSLTADQLASSGLKLVNASPAKNGVYVGILGDPANSFYQMVLIPEEAATFPAGTTRKMMLVFDYNSDNVNGVSQSYLLNQMKQQLKERLTPQDSFNLIFSNLFIEPWSEVWLPADPQTIDATFAALAAEPIAEYSNLPSLLAEGIQFINETGGSGTLLLAASNDDFDDLQSANTLVEDLLNLMGDNQIPINILDYQNRNIGGTWIGNRYYRGNEYLYTNLSQLTGGEFVNQINCCPTPSLDENVVSIFGMATGLQGQIDIYTGLAEGFCYQRYTLGQTGDISSLNKPIRQFGKYNGQFPFHIELAGEYQNNFFGNVVSIPENELIQSDSFLNEAWTGQLIQQLEQSGGDNGTISNIINQSIDARVLSIYTALIALEPSQGGEICLECVDESGEVVSTEDPLEDLLMLEAFPNPFKEKVNIRVQLSDKVRSEDCDFSIFNLMGQQVFSFAKPNLTGTNEFNFTWEGQSSTGVALAGGIYFFVAATPNGQAHLRLNYVK